MVWSILLWICAALLVLAGLLVVLPVRVRCSWQSDPAKRATVQLRPFGGVFPAIPVYNSRRQRPDKPKPDARSKKPAKKRGKGRINLRRIAFADVTDLLDRVIHAFHVETLQVDAEFGLDDPADTGQLYGQLTPLVYSTGSHLQLRPNFTEACLRGCALLQFRFTPLGLIWPFVRFGWRVLGPVR